MYNKHYIRLDTDNRITKGFSDAFEEPLESDVCINEQAGRHFELNGETNHSLTDLNGCHLYKYENEEIKETTEEERMTELESFPKVIRDKEQRMAYSIDLDYRLSKLELGV